MPLREIAGDVELHSGLSEGEGGAAVRAVLVELGGAFLDADRRELQRLWPEWLAEVLGRGQFRGDLDAEGLFDRVAGRLGLDRARAVELTKLTCAATAHRLEAGLLRVTQTHLPVAIADLLTDLPHDPSPPPPARRSAEVEPGAGRTLATGRPGGQRPVSESGPTGHADSPARTTDPHADSRLSSAPGTRQERERDTLATGRGGSKHPVSEDD